MDESSTAVKITFRIEGDQWHRHGSESLWADSLGGNRYRLANVPFFVRGVGFGDVVEAVQSPLGLQFESVVERGGHSTLRVVSRDSGEMEDLARRLREMECDCETGEIGSTIIVAVDVWPEADVDAVIEVLEAGRAESRWDWEVGFDGHPSAEKEGE